MLSRLYAFAFMVSIIGALWYQRVYLKRSTVEFNAQLMAEGAVLPVMSATKYVSNLYENGVFKSFFSGMHYTYYSNKNYLASGHLLYHDFSSPQENKIDDSDDILVTTSQAYGQMISVQHVGSAASLMSKSKLKDVIMPNQVHFVVNKHQGITSDVYVDAIAGTVHSNKKIQIQGDSGSVKGLGFFYATSSGDFRLESCVSGMIYPNQLPKK